MPHAGGKNPALTETARRFVRDAVQQATDLTLEELRRRLKTKYKQVVSLPTLWRLLQHLDLPRKNSPSTLVNATARESSKRARHMRKRASNSM